MTGDNGLKMPKEFEYNEYNIKVNKKVENQLKFEGNKNGKILPAETVKSFAVLNLTSY